MARNYKRDHKGRFAKVGSKIRKGYQVKRAAAKSNPNRYSAIGRGVGGTVGLAIGAGIPGTVGYTTAAGVMAGGLVGRAFDLRVAKKRAGRG